MAGEGRWGAGPCTFGRLTTQEGRPGCSSWIKRTPHSAPAVLQHVRVEHGRAHVLVAQECLHGANIVPSSTRCVAKECRKVWHLPCFGRPARPMASLTALCSIVSDIWCRRSIPERGGSWACYAACSPRRASEQPWASSGTSP